MAEKQKKKWIKADEAKKKLEAIDVEQATQNEGRFSIERTSNAMMAKRYGSGKKETGKDS